MKDPYADLDRDIDIGPEARQAARGWAHMFLLFGVIVPVVVLAVLWLGGVV